MVKYSSLSVNQPNLNNGVIPFYYFQEIPPFETKPVMRASFVGRIENNHTAFIRIKTNRDKKDEVLILPVEVGLASQVVHELTILWGGVFTWFCCVEFFIKKQKKQWSYHSETILFKYSYVAIT